MRRLACAFALLAATAAGAQTPVIGAAGSSVVPPTIASLNFATQFNWQGSTYESNVATGVMFGDVKAASTFMEAIGRAYPSQPFTMDVQLAVMPDPQFVIGIGVASGTSSRMEEMEYHVNGSIQIDVQDWTTPTSYSGTPSGSAFTPPQYASIWLRLQDDGTNLKWYYSTDGANWFLQWSETKAGSFVSSTGFNYLIITMSPYAANMQTVIQSFRLTTP